MLGTLPCNSNDYLQEYHIWPGHVTLVCEDKKSMKTLLYLSSLQSYNMCARILLALSLLGDYIDIIMYRYHYIKILF